MQEHRDTIEADAINLDAGVAQIVDAGAEPADCRLIEAFVMVAADEYLVAMGQVAQPVEEVDGLALAPHHAEVARVHDHVSFGQVAQSPVASVSV